MKKKLFNALFVGLLVCSTYVFAFANVLAPDKKNCDGNGHWEQWYNHPGKSFCYDGGTECNAGDHN